MDLTVFPLAARIPSPPISGFQIGPLRVTFYGILIAVGIAVAWRLTRLRFEAKGGDGAQIDRILQWAVALGFLGARAAYVVTHTGRFEGRWWGVLAIWEGGLAFFGGLTVGTITAVILARRLGIGLGVLTDSAAPALPLAQPSGDGVTTSTRNYSGPLLICRGGWRSSPPIDRRPIRTPPHFIRHSSTSLSGTCCW